MRRTDCQEEDRILVHIDADDVGVSVVDVISAMTNTALVGNEPCCSVHQIMSVRIVFGGTWDDSKLELRGGTRGPP